MFGNPFALVFRKAFYKDVLDNAFYTGDIIPPRAERINAFLGSLNKFLRTAGQAPILHQNYKFEEKKLFEYALFLRGYMRDAQPILANLQQKYAADVDMIELFKSASEYVVACNHKLNDKRVFDNNVGYRCWSVEMPDSLENATYLPAQKVNEKNHNLFMFMPFRLKDDEQQLQKWVYNNMRQTLDNKQIFGSKVDMYVINYPIQKSRSSNIASLLETINETTYFEPQDLDFVKENWLNFLGKNIKLDKNNNVVSGECFTPEKLQENMQNITIFSYCSGTANAHRCLNILGNISQQMYGKELTAKAMQNVFVVSYGFLPIQKQSNYSGVHFYTNAVNDQNRKEPFVNLNNHQLYEKTKCTNSTTPARISVMPDNRNFIVAFKLPEQLTVLKNKQLEVINDAEYGHNLANVNTPNLRDKDNFAFHLFKNVLEKSSLGIRGKNVLNIAPENENPQAYANNKLAILTLQNNLNRLR